MDNTQATDLCTCSRGVQLAGTRHRRIYIAGPMTGLPEWNYPAFNAQALELRKRGYHVENPAEHGIVEHAEWVDYLRYDIGRLAACESIFLLPGWEKSNGARLEVSIAKALSMTFIHHPDAKYVTDVEATDFEILEAAYVRAGQREHELRLLLVERNARIAELEAITQAKAAPSGEAVAIVNVERPGNIEWLCDPAPADATELYTHPAPAPVEDERAAFMREFQLDGRFTYDENTKQWLPCADVASDFAMLARLTAVYCGWQARAALQGCAAAGGDRLRSMVDQLQVNAVHDTDLIQSLTVKLGAKTAEVERLEVEVAKLTADNEQLRGLLHKYSRRGLSPVLTEDELDEIDAALAEPDSGAVVPDEILHVWRATDRFGRPPTHFGDAAVARAYAGKGGTVERVELKPAPELVVVPAVNPGLTTEGITAKALELCRAVENEEGFPPAKFALRCLMLVGQIRKLAEEAPAPKQGEQKGDGWISCVDRFPEKVNSEYLCLFPHGNIQVSEWEYDDVDGWCFLYGDPTHWMPLPEPPAHRAKQGE